MRLLTVGVVGSLLVIAALAGAEESAPAQDNNASETTSSDASSASESSSETTSSEASASSSDTSSPSSETETSSGEGSTQSTTSESSQPASSESAPAEPSTTASASTEEKKEETKDTVEEATPEVIRFEAELVVNHAEFYSGEEILFDAPEPETPAEPTTTQEQSQPEPCEQQAQQGSSGSGSSQGGSSGGNQGPIPAPILAAAHQALPLVPGQTLPVQIPVLQPPTLPSLKLDLIPAAPERSTVVDGDGVPEKAAPAILAPSSALVEEQKVDPVVAMMAATIVLGATASVTAWSVPGWQKYLVRAARVAGLGFLFSRLTDDALLNHPRRNEINEYVLQNPGERLETVRRALGLSNGSMLHHVRILDARNLVRVVRDGAMTRLYPAGPRIQPAPYVPAARRRLLELVQSSPGCTQREIAARYGASERMVSYHLGQLRANGLVDVRRDGTSKRCFPLEGIPA